MILAAIGMAGTLFYWLCLIHWSVAVFVLCLGILRILAEQEL